MLLIIDSPLETYSHGVPMLNNDLSNNALPLSPTTLPDPYLWLEDRNGEKATAWARVESEITKRHFEQDPRFSQATQELLKVFNSPEKIPMPQMFEGFVYHLWQDDFHQRGLWRRTSVDEYIKETPSWEVLLDLDKLSSQEQEPWVYKCCIHLPGSDQVMVALCRNNQDAVEWREFSLTKKEFIKDGFVLPESKSAVEWFDEDHLIVAAAFTPDQQTNSGYPRKVYLWTRGEDFSQSRLLYEGKKEHVATWPNITHRQGKTTLVIGIYVDYDFHESYLFDQHWNATKFPLPPFVALTGNFQDFWLLENRHEWQGFPAGSLLSVPKAVVELQEIPREWIKAIFQPSESAFYYDFATTRDRMYLQINENVRGQICEARLSEEGAWSLEKIYHSENTYSLCSTDKEGSAAIFTEEGYLRPRGFLMRRGSTSWELKKTPSFFNEDRLVTEQFWTRSPDGTEIPYTLVRAKDLNYNGQNPTIVSGYGGFMLARLPTYNPTMGKAWLEKGGVYVMANIRGGSEFGPRWHKEAILENKQKSYDDFIAVTEDLIRRKITSPSHLALQGGSNGGLLVGAVAMQRPELFKAILCQIPLLDMIRYTKMPPGASWVGEYGDPEDPKFHELILKYSPYQNLSRNKKYPKIFFQTTQADDRVHPGHARKMAARMQEYGHPRWFLESFDGGHGVGGVKPEDMAKSQALLYVFLYQELFQAL